MFEELLTKPQKRLLGVLHGADHPLSVLDLSQLAEMPYATTYTTLRKLRATGLVVPNLKNGKVRHTLNREDADTNKLLELLLKNVSKENGVTDRDATDEDVLWNLAALGAPLVVESTTRRKLSPESTVALALKVVRRNPAAARALPLVFAGSLSRMNYARLRYLAKRGGDTKTLGFFLDLTDALKGGSRLKSKASELLDRRVKQSEPFFSTSLTNYAVMLANRKTPPLARKWHFTMNMTMNDFRSFFDKFYHGPTPIQLPRH